MWIATGNLGNQSGQFFVSEIVVIWNATIVANKGLIELIRLKLPELRRRPLLRAVAAIVEERDVFAVRLAQVRTELVNDSLTGSLFVLQNYRLEVILIAGDALK